MLTVYISCGEFVLTMTQHDKDVKEKKNSSAPVIFCWIVIVSVPGFILLWHIIIPWFCYESYSGKVLENPELRLVIHHHGETGQLGNVMFSYASIKGIAFATSRTSTFAHKFTQLRSAFSNTQMKIDTSRNQNYYKVRDLALTTEGGGT